MLAKDILKLIDAGFIKEEIMKLDADDKIVPDQEPAAAPEGVKEDEAPKPAPEVKPAEPSGVTLSDDQFTKLLQQLNVKGATLDVPPESDLATKLGDHFKDVIIGK